MLILPWPSPLPFSLCQPAPCQMWGRWGAAGGLLGLPLVPQQRWWSRWWEAPRAQRRAPLPRRHLPHGDGAHLGHGNGGGALGEMGW